MTVWNYVCDFMTACNCVCGGGGGGCIIAPIHVTGCGSVTACDWVRVRGCRTTSNHITMCGGVTVLRSGMDIISEDDLDQAANVAVVVSNMHNMAR